MTKTLTVVDEGNEKPPFTDVYFGDIIISELIAENPELKLNKYLMEVDGIPYVFTVSSEVEIERIQVDVDEYITVAVSGNLSMNIVHYDMHLRYPDMW